MKTAIRFPVFAHRGLFILCPHIQSIIMPVRFYFTN
ncbi:hypothetical protein [Enterocloster phage PMBT24]|uniref:Uncharacterized protein n=1 Tax=Enterocloster phage PMBT24 TaxID=3025413 RepID=A0AAT9TTD0_9CAUD|nr:hypothetical protein [Enterocloster phage PMBT24]